MMDWIRMITYRHIINLLVVLLLLLLCQQQSNIFCENSMPSCFLNKNISNNRHALIKGFHGEGVIIFDEHLYLLML